MNFKPSIHPRITILTIKKIRYIKIFHKNIPKWCIVVQKKKIFRHFYYVFYIKIELLVGLQYWNGDHNFNNLEFSLNIQAFEWFLRQGFFKKHILFSHVCSYLPLQ